MKKETVAVRFSPVEAQMDASSLIAAGFDAEVVHETSALSIDGYALAVGGIQVQVPASQAAEARQFLAEAKPLPE